LYQRPARGLQHDSDSAARRRQRHRRSVAARARVPVRFADPPVRFHPAVRPDAHSRSRLSDRPPIVAAALVAPVNPSTALRARPRVVSGMRPTGLLHIGHLVGALSNWVPLQEKYDCFYFVADWHALTTEFADTKQLTANAYENVA